MLGRVCIAHPGHAIAVPIENHHVRPVARGGQGTKTVQMCANAHGAVHDLLDRIEEQAIRSPYSLVNEIVRALPADVWADYSGAVRVVAYKGWQLYGLAFIGGMYETEHRLWRSDGSPRSEGVPAYTELLHAARWSRRWRRILERQ